ncbi:unnamed protein product, partial [Mesorhabditis spiculigera]
MVKSKSSAVSSFLRTNNVMLLMGSDFQYTNANPWFDNMDKLIKYVNANKSLNVNVLYSTPACYVNAHSFWTGYFTSRPGLKGMIRKASSYLQLAKQLDAQFFLGPTDDSDVEIMKKASALTQHHDAVTGTAKENVTRDYELRLHKALTELEQVINDALAVNPSKKAPAQYKLCLLTNETAIGPERELGQHGMQIGSDKGRASARRSAKGAADLHRPLAVKKFNEPILAYAPVEDFADYRSKYVTKFDGLTRELPPFVNLLTLEKKGGKTLLLRLEHIYQSSDEATNSKPMDISLKGLFTRFEISAIKELSLAANRNITNFFRLRDDFVVHINPQEIKTFELSVKEN